MREQLVMPLYYLNENNNISFPELDLVTVKLEEKLLRTTTTLGLAKQSKKSIVVILKLLLSDLFEFFFINRAATLIPNQQLHTKNAPNRKTAESITNRIMSVIHKGIIGESANMINAKSMFGIATIVAKSFSFPFCFQFYTRLTAVFAEEFGYFGMIGFICSIECCQPLFGP